MKYLIIGNGPAGTTAAATIREYDKNAYITILSYENYPYYARPRLPEFIEDKIPEDKLIIYNRDWYAKKNIELLLQAKVMTINPELNTIILIDREFSYDRLILATGAFPNSLPLSTKEINNIFTLRTVDDAFKIKEAIRDKKEVILIGGGPLGLELANSIANKGKRVVKVLEIAENILSRFLTTEQSIKLQKMLEERGFSFFLDDCCLEISEKNRLIELYTKKGKTISGEALVISVGASPRIELAQQANLLVKKGIILNHYLQTSNPNIYACGDCIELNNKTWGFVKSSIEQGKIAGINAVKGNYTEYKDTVIDLSLKIDNIDFNKL